MKNQNVITKRRILMKKSKKLLLLATIVSIVLSSGTLVNADALTLNTEDTACNLTDVNNDYFTSSSPIDGPNDSDFYMVYNPQSSNQPYIYTFSLQSPVSANVDMQVVIYNETKQITYLNKDVEDNGLGQRDSTYFILNPGEKAYVRVHSHGSSYSSRFNYTLTYRRT